MIAFLKSVITYFFGGILSISLKCVYMWIFFFNSSWLGFTMTHKHDIPRSSSTPENLQELHLSYYLYSTLCIHSSLLIRNMLVCLIRSSMFPKIAFILFYFFNSLCFLLRNVFISFPVCTFSNSYI